MNANIDTGGATVQADSSIAIGFNSFVDGDNSIALGNGVYVNANNTVQIGNGNVTCIGGAVGWSIVSDARFKTNVKQDVPGLDFIRKLRPVTYHLDMVEMVKFKGGHAADGQLSDLKSGFIAQEIAQAADELGYDFDAVTRPQNESNHYSLSYGQFVVPLTKAVQELDAQNKSLSLELTALKAKYEEILVLLKQNSDKIPASEE